jgi:epoxyqueuosine reductase
MRRSSASRWKVSRIHSTSISFKYRTVLVNHLEDLQKDIDKLKNENRLSKHTIYQSYLQELRFKIPENLPDAKSLIILAIPTRLLQVRFHQDGKVREATFPSNYCSDSLIVEEIEKAVFQQILKKSNSKLERTHEVHLKLLAVRSGLGEYGRNNLCNVEGMGSLHRLWGFFTNCELEDNWNEIRMMQTCKNCRACINSCPNHCLSEESFVIDAGRCLSLFNEIEGVFPEWIDPQAHNSLMGCMRCQLVCPANRNALATTRRLEDITEKETLKILKGEPDQELLSSLSRKLGNIYPTRSAESFPILQRNLQALLNAKSSSKTA